MTKAEFLIKENGFIKKDKAIDKTDNGFEVYEKIIEIDFGFTHRVLLGISRKSKKVILNTQIKFNQHRHPSTLIDKPMLEMLNAIYEEMEEDE